MKNIIKTKSIKLSTIVLLFFAMLCTSVLTRNKVYADLDNCDGFIFTESKSGKKACILDGWKKETKNPTPMSGDYFYYGDTDIFVTIDVHLHYDDLSESDKKKYTKESVEHYTSPNSEIEKVASSDFYSELYKQLGLSG